MAHDELVVLLPGGKERLAHRDAAAELGVSDALHDAGELFRLLSLGIERRPDRHEAGRFVGEDGVLVVELQRLPERLPEPLQKVQRAAQKEHRTLDAPPLREARDRLIDDRLQDGGGDVRLARPLVEEGLDIRLREHAAAGSDGIDALRLEGELVELRYSDIEKGRHLVDERTRAARAASVHALFGAARDEDDLGVLAAQFHRGIRIRIEAADGAEGSLHLLHEADLPALRKPEARRTRDARLILPFRVVELCKFFQNALPHLGEVPHISGREDIPALVDHTDLYRCGTDVDPKQFCHSINRKIRTFVD